MKGDELPDRGQTNPAGTRFLHGCNDRLQEKSSYTRVEKMGEMGRREKVEERRGVNTEKSMVRKRLPLPHRNNELWAGREGLSKGAGEGGGAEKVVKRIGISIHL